MSHKGQLNIIFQIQWTQTLICLNSVLQVVTETVTFATEILIK